MSVVKRIDIYGPSIGQTPHVYWKCETEEEAWAKFDKWQASRAAKGRYGKRAKNAKLLKRGKTWTEVTR